MDPTKMRTKQCPNTLPISRKQIPTVSLSLRLLQTTVSGALLSHSALVQRDSRIVLRCSASTVPILRHDTRESSSQQPALMLMVNSFLLLLPLSTLKTMITGCGCYNFFIV